MRKLNMAIGAAALAGASVMGGCLVGGSSSVRSSGTYVSGETLALIDEGQSTERELLDLLGAPSRTMRHHDGRTIYAYQYTMDAKSSGGVFLIAGGSSRARVERTTYFEITDGVVTRFWTDGAGDDARSWAKDAERDCDEPAPDDFEEVS